MTYPKLPTGPSPQGCAGARALGDTTFQRKRSADFIATVKDGYSRVEVLGGDIYATNGKLTSSSNSPLALDHVTGAGHKTSYITNWYNSSNIYFEAIQTERGLLSHNYASGQQTVKFSTSLSVSFTRWYNSNWFDDYYAQPSYFGRVQKGGNTVVKLGAVTPVQSGVMDAYGNNLLLPKMVYIYGDGATSSVGLPLSVGTTGAPKYFFNTQRGPVVTKNYIYVLVFETCPYGGAAPGAPLPVWLCSSIDGVTWSAENILSKLPHLNSSPGSWATQALAYCNTAADADYWTHGVACGDGSALFSVTSTWFTGNTQTTEHYPDLVRVDNGVSTALTLTTDTTLHGGVTAMVYVGNNKLMLTYSHFNVSNAVDFVDFYSSTDNGNTWTYHNTPTGFNCPLIHEYMGSNYLVLDKAAGPSDNGSVLMTAWDQTAGAYYIYATADLGATWVRKGRITQPILPANFAATYGTIGYQYDILRIIPGVGSSRKLDPALPTRYTGATVT